MLSNCLDPNLHNFHFNTLTTFMYSVPGPEQPLNKWSGILIALAIQLRSQSSLVKVQSNNLLMLILSYHIQLLTLYVKHICMCNMPALGGSGACSPENFENLHSLRLNLRAFQWLFYLPSRSTQQISNSVHTCLEQIIMLNSLFCHQIHILPFRIASKYKHFISEVIPSDIIFLHVSIKLHKQLAFVTCEATIIFTPFYQNLSYNALALFFASQ